MEISKSQWIKLAEEDTGLIQSTLSITISFCTSRKGWLNPILMQPFFAQLNLRIAYIKPYQSESRVSGLERGREKGRIQFELSGQTLCRDGAGPGRIGPTIPKEMPEPRPLSSVSLKPSHHGCEAVVELQERWRPYHWNLSQATSDHTDVLNRGICSKCDSGAAALFLSPR